MQRPILFFAIFLIALSPHFSRAQAIKHLENFWSAAASGQASFVQRVQAPPKDGEAARAKESAGSFAFARPAKFRFVYSRPYAQTIVADGSQLWWYDEDLNQVTVRPQAAALGQTAAALIAAGSLDGVRKDFQLTEEAARDGQDWLLATPRKADGTLTQIRLGFRAQDAGAVVPTTLEMRDSFGQTSTLVFSQWQLNKPVSAALFVFKPPAGADIIRP